MDKNVNEGVRLSENQKMYAKGKMYFRQQRDNVQYSTVYISTVHNLRESFKKYAKETPKIHMLSGKL